MPRLQILHHKSYHPYLEKNKQRVREDEAKAKAEEEEREAQRIDAESTSRLNALRRRAGSPGVEDSIREDPGDLPSTSSQRDIGVGSGGLLERHRKAKLRAEKEERRRKERLDFDFPSETAKKEKRRAEKEGINGIRGKDGVWGGEQQDGDAGSSLWESGGHLNLFADLERQEQANPAGQAGKTLEGIAKKANSGEPRPDAHTVFLSRPDRETKPWYSDKELRRVEDMETGEEAEIRRARDKRKDARSKIRHDPLTSITSELAKTAPRPQPNFRGPPTPKDPILARQHRENNERQRALALIAQKRGGGGGGWDDTPSSAAGWSERIEREKERAGHRFYSSRY